MTTPAELRALIAAKGMTQAEAARVMHRKLPSLACWLAGTRTIDELAVANLRRSPPITRSRPPRTGPRKRSHAPNPANSGE